MSDVSVKCVFCEKETCEKVKKFTSETLTKCITVLEYRKAKPVRRKSINAYATIKISHETSLNDGYHVQCYKLFTAVKIPSDFQGKNEFSAESAQECNDALELAAESPELSISSTSTTQTAGATVDDVSQALPALHALTGCDYNPAFYRRGKKKPLDILLGSTTFQEAFANLGSETYDIEKLIPTMESFFCHLYGLNKVADVNCARMEIFNKTYKVSDTSQPFSLNVHNYDACNLPPCQSELRQHLLRTKYIACLWRNAHYRIDSEMSPTNCGWKNVGGKLEPTWFVGDQLPKAYEDIVITPDILGDTIDSETQDDEEIDHVETNFEDESSEDED